METGPQLSLIRQTGGSNLGPLVDKASDLSTTLQRLLIKCKTKKLGMIYTILGCFCSFFNWEGADILPQIRPRKSPASQPLHTDLDSLCTQILINNIFMRKIVNIFLLISFNICFGCSKELSH